MRTEQQYRHLDQMDLIIGDYKALIARHKRHISDIAQSDKSIQLREDTLHAYESSLRAFEKQRELIVSQLNKR
jgi:hypothetical protein